MQLVINEQRASFTGDSHLGVNWDGVTCADKPKNMLLLADSKVFTPLRLDNPNALQVDLWLQMNVTGRGSAGFSDARLRSNEVAEFDATIFKLSLPDEAQTALLEIRIVQTSLTCKLFGHGKFTDQVVKYEDFDFSTEQWQRVSCWFEGLDNGSQRARSNTEATRFNILQGSLMKSGETHLYYDYETNWDVDQRRELFYNGQRMRLADGPLTVNMSMGGSVKVRPSSDAGIFVQHLRVWNRVLDESHAQFHLY